MMWKSRQVVASCVAVLTLTAFGATWAEPIRTLLTKENKLPAKWQVEAGLLGEYANYKDEFILSKAYEVAPYGRFGLFENLAVSLEVPYRNVKNRISDTEQGLGDVRLGLDFVPWQDLFSFPWIMPHVTVGLPTGDEDKGLGRGKTTGQFGVAVGTVVNEEFHFIADGRYEVISGSDSTDDNVASLAGAIVWDLSEQFSLLGEIKITNQDNDPYEGTPIYFNGGMSYKATEALALMFYAGGSQNTPEDFTGSMKIAYSF